MKKILLILTSLYLIFPLAGLTIKVASPLPEGSEWHIAISRMAEEWNEITGGAVRLRIYPGGIAGTGEDVIRKMRIGQVDMAVLTAAGLTSIVPDTFAMSMPFYLRTEEELDFVIHEIAPTFDDAFREKGFNMLGWSKSGWIYYFSVEEMTLPEELRNLKMAVSPEEPEMVEAFKEMRFDVIPLDMNSILMGLQSGMIQTMYTSPLVAASYQWFALAPYMMDLKIAPLLGGLIISERTWNRIPSRYHQDLQESVDKMTGSFFARTQELERQALEVMIDNGLKIIPVSEEIIPLWRSIPGDDFSGFVGAGKVVSRSLFDDYTARVESFRNR